MFSDIDVGDEEMRKRERKEEDEMKRRMRGLRIKAETWDGGAVNYKKGRESFEVNRWKTQ